MNSQHPDYGPEAEEAERTSLADVRHPLLKWAADFWQRARGAAPWPPVTCIDPFEIRPLLGNVVLLDVLDQPEGMDLKYRLFGAEFVHWFGFDMTGRTVRQWPSPEYRGHMLTSYTEMLAQRQPVRRFRRIVKDGRQLHYECLLLPFGPPDRIIRVMTVQYFIDSPP